ncbi:MAG: CBS domain-containing protein [Pirellulaceae bacterium]
MGLKENLHEETVSRLPIRDAIAVAPDATAREAVTKMRDKQLGCAVIVDDHRTVVGIFTERGVIDALIDGRKLDDVQVGQSKDPEFMTVKETEPISKVWDAVVDRGQRFVCVTSESGKLLGLTGQRGLSEYVSEYYPQQVMVQRLGGKPWMKHREGA